MPVWPSWSSLSTLAMSCTQSFFLGRTSYVRLGRLNDWQQTTARCRPRMDMQSSLTRGVAVAVSARMGTSAKEARSEASLM